MNSKEFYNYIISGVHNRDARQFIQNAIDYVEAQGFVDVEDARKTLKALLKNAAPQEWEFNLYRSDADYSYLLDRLDGPADGNVSSESEFARAVELISEHEHGECICGPGEQPGDEPRKCYGGAYLNDEMTYEEFVSLIKELVEKEGGN